jgi:hypothetical protein
MRINLAAALGPLPPTPAAVIASASNRAEAGLQQSTKV